MSRIEDLDKLKDTLENSEAQRGLLRLYKDSQSECTRNGVCSMEIGTSRERDLAAVLKHFLGDEINLDINNKLPEDLVVGNSKISVKHSCSKVGSSVKGKWTSADNSAEEAIKQMINAEDSYYPTLLLIYINIREKKITIFCISSEENKNIIKTLKENAFKRPNGNSRGIEYSTTAMKELLKKRYFKIEISNADLTGGIDPIKRRRQILDNTGIKP